MNLTKNKLTKVEEDKLLRETFQRFNKSNIDEDTLTNTIKIKYIEAFNEFDETQTSESLYDYVHRYIVIGILDKLLLSEDDSKILTNTEESSTKLSQEEKAILAEENMRLVYFIVNKFTNTRIPLEEFESVALVGYAKALEAYDKSRKVKFSTYAYNCIKNEILFFLRKEKKHRENTSSLNSPLSIDKNGNALTVESTISTVDQGDRTVEEIIVVDETVSVLQKVIIENLTETERFIITNRFGLNGGDVLTQKQIADEIGMSQANVSKLEKNITSKIRKIMSSRYKIKDLNF